MTRRRTKAADDDTAAGAHRLRRAHLFTADVAQKLGAAALETLDEHAPDESAFGSAVQWPVELASRVYPRIVENEPVEVGKAAQATSVGEVFDDAAMDQGLLNDSLRAVNCGAITDAEAVALNGLTLEEIRGRSFITILTNRRRV